MRTVHVDGLERDVLLWTFVAMRARFVAGTGSATLTLRLDHREQSGLYDWTLREWPSAGTTGGKPAIHYRAADEADLWAVPFFLGDELVLEWTNPASGTMRWYVEVFLAYAALAPLRAG